METNKSVLMVRALICAVALTLAYSITSFAAAADSVRQDCVRLHILANSDSDEDQALKIKVRDALLENGSELFSGAVTAADAEQKLASSYDELTAVAKKVITDEGYSYDVSIGLYDEYFTTRSYDNFTMPAGNYTAIKVIIGEGKGHNWWCVMFPPLCLPGCSENIPEEYLTEDGSQLIEESPKLEPRFKIVEWYEELCDKLN